MLMNETVEKWEEQTRHNEAMFHYILQPPPKLLRSITSAIHSVAKRVSYILLPSG